MIFHFKLFTVVITSMANQDFVQCDPGFFYQVFDPEQPLGLPLHSNLLNYYAAAPSHYYNPAPLHVPYAIKGCTNNLGLPVPCNLADASTIVPIVPETAAPETLATENTDTVVEAISSEKTAVTSAVIEARRKRDAEPNPYYLGYGLAGYYGYYPYAYSHGFGYGCRNYLGVLVPCA